MEKYEKPLLPESRMYIRFPLTNQAQYEASAQNQAGS